MNLSMFVLGGVILMGVGVVQALVRPRQPNERGLSVWINRATIRGLFFVIVGVLAVLVGLGLVPFARLPGG